MGHIVVHIVVHAVVHAVVHIVVRYMLWVYCGVYYEEVNPIRALIGG